MNIGGTYKSSPKWLTNEKAIINPKNFKDEECFKYKVLLVLHRNEIQKHPEREIFNFLLLTQKYHLKRIKFLTDQKDWNKFKQKIKPLY